MLKIIFRSLVKPRNERLNLKFQDVQKTIVVEEPKSKSDSNTMDEIDNYKDGSDQASDEVGSSVENNGSGDESTSGDSEIIERGRMILCPCQLVLRKSYNLTTYMDELGSFPPEISIRARMTLYHDFRNVLLYDKYYKDFKGSCFGYLRHIP